MGQVFIGKVSPDLGQLESALEGTGWINLQRAAAGNLSCLQDGAGAMNRFPLCSLAKVGRTLVALLNSKVRLTPTAPALCPHLAPVHTQCHA